MNTVIIVTAFIIALILAFVPEIKGWLGEKKVARKLSQLPEGDYRILNNVIVKTSFGTSQIDHIVVSTYGIFVIETKNYKGWIYGSEQSSLWTKNVYGKKYQFRNPIKQNYGHVKSLESVLDLSFDKFIPIVVFLGNATLKVKVKSIVVYPGKLARTIKGFGEEKIDKDDLDLIVDKLKNENEANKDLRKQHVKDINTKIKAEEIAVKEGVCPRCGGQLVSRKGKYGEFLGCSNYPKCKYTNNLK